MIVLSHEVISHHHHDTMANISIIDAQNDKHSHDHNDMHNHHHNSPDKKNNEKDSNENHNHPFPFHHHISTTNDFDYTRINITNSYPEIQIITASLVLSAIFGELSEPPNLIVKRYRKKIFLIQSSFIPGAIALRGPPSLV